MAKNPETEIANAIIKGVTKKFPNCWIHKNVVARVKMFSSFYSQVGLGVSSPDIIICMDGKFIGFEVKVPGKDPTEEQKEWGVMIRGKGGIYECVRSLEDAVNILDKIRVGEYIPNPL